MKIDHTFFQNKQLICACGVGDVDAVVKLINDGADVDCVSQDENGVCTCTCNPSCVTITYLLVV